MTIKFRDFLVNYDPTRDEYLQYRAQKRRRMGGSGGPVGESVWTDDPDVLFEGLTLTKFVDALRGWSQADVDKKVAKLNKDQLKSIVRHANPKSAKRVLPPKDYALWSSAYKKLQSMSESVESIEEKKKSGMDAATHREKMLDKLRKSGKLKDPKTDNESRLENEEAEVDEALTMAQRRKAAQRFKKYKSRIKIGRERAARRVASKEVLMKRARKAARTAIMKRLIKDTPKSELDFARREQIEKRLDKMKPKIDQLAKKLLPKLRKAEMERKRGSSKK